MIIHVHVHFSKNYNLVELPIKDPPRRGHNRNNLTTKDTIQSPKCSFSHNSEERTNSLQRTKWLTLCSEVLDTVHVHFPIRHLFNTVPYILQIQQKPF